MGTIEVILLRRSAASVVPNVAPELQFQISLFDMYLIFMATSLASPPVKLPRSDFAD